MDEETDPKRQGGDGCGKALLTTFVGLIVLAICLYAIVASICSR